MGLENKLISQGSSFGAGVGGNSANLQSERNAVIGSKSTSKLHYEYSINGMPNIEPPYIGFPKPSQLDLNGIAPLGPNRDGRFASINNTFSGGTYKNSAPAAGIGRI